MRLSHRGGGTVHLSCDTNLPPVPDLPALIARLDAYATARTLLGVDALGLSLWLPPSLAAALAVDTRGRARLHAELHTRGLEVVTLSGQAYGETPGSAWSQPDWSTDERLEYTLDLARILVDLLPDDAVRGSVATTGIGHREEWDDTRERAGARILGRLSSGLAEIAWQTGRAVRVGMQPAPGAVLDSVEQTITALARVDKDRVGVSLDLAALNHTWPEPAEALARLTAAGISIIKVQVAPALKAPDPAASALREYSEAALRHLMAGDTLACEYLEVRTRAADAAPSGADLPRDTESPETDSPEADSPRPDSPRPELPDGASGAAQGAQDPNEIAAEVAYTRDLLFGLGLSVKGACAAR